MDYIITTQTLPFIQVWANETKFQIGDFTFLKILTRSQMTKKDGTSQ